MKRETFENLPDNFLSEITEKEAFGGTSGTKITDFGQDRLLEDGKGDKGKKKMWDNIGEDKSFADEEGDDRIPFENLINGRLLLDVADGILAGICIWLLQTFAKRTAKHSDMTLTEKEKDILDPIVDKCLAYIDWEIKNPFALFGICMFFIYMSKSWNKSVPYVKPKKSTKPDTSKQASGAQEAETVSETAQKEKEEQLKQADFVDEEKDEPKQVLYYKPSEVKAYADKMKVTKASAKQRLANRNNKKNIKTVFLKDENSKQ